MQQANIDHAISLGEKVIRNSRTITEMKNKKDNSGEASSFLQDSMMYFSFSDTAAALEFLPLLLKDFKNQMIEIKIANDKMLLEGGFVPAVDREIAEIFRPGGLGDTKVDVSKIADDVEAAIEILKRLKEELV